MNEIAEQYHVSGSCIEDINKGKNRFNPSLSYPLRKNASSIGHAMTTSQFTADEIMLMRQRYVNESLKDILKDYPQLTESGLKKILYGYYILAAALISIIFAFCFFLILPV